MPDARKAVSVSSPEQIIEPLIDVDREVLTTVLIYHARTDTSGCHCGWAALGLSYADHVADVYEQSITARGEEQSGATTETEYMLMVDYLGFRGIFGTDQERLDHRMTQDDVLKYARKRLEHAGCIEVWTREVPAEWTKVEELRR